MADFRLEANFDADQDTAKVMVNHIAKYASGKNFVTTSESATYPAFRGSFNFSVLAPLMVRILNKARTVAAPVDMPCCDSVGATLVAP